MDLTLPVKILSHGEGLDLPEYQTPGSAGMDLRAAVDSPQRLLPMSRAAIPTGISLAIPAGFEGQIRPRSGLAFRHGISIPNAPGTIDSDYRGELKVLLINLGTDDFVITRGMRIAQLVIAPCMQMPMEIRTVLDQTERGSGGFGSTGKDT